MNKQERKLKELRKQYNHYRELNKLSVTQRELVSFPEPMQFGYKRYFILSREARSHKDVEIFKEILEHLQNEQIDRREDFTYKGRGRERKYKKHQFQVITNWHWNRWNPSPKVQSYFKAETAYWSPYSKTMSVRYIFQMPWLFDSVVEPNMLTSFYRPSHIHESAANRLYNRFTRLHLWGLINKAMNFNSYRNYYADRHSKEYLMQKQIMKEIRQENDNL